MKAEIIKQDEVFKTMLLTISIESKEELDAVEALAKTNIDVPEAVHKFREKISEESIKEILKVISGAIRNRW